MSVKGETSDTAGLPSRLYSTVTSIERLTVPSGLKVLPLVPTIRPRSKTYSTASRNQSFSRTSVKEPTTGTKICWKLGVTVTAPAGMMKVYSVSETFTVETVLPFDLVTVSPVGA